MTPRQNTSPHRSREKYGDDPFPAEAMMEKSLIESPSGAPVIIDRKDPEDVHALAERLLGYSCAEWSGRSIAEMKSEGRQRTWAEDRVDRGAVFYFSWPNRSKKPAREMGEDR